MQPGWLLIELMPKGGVFFPFSFLFLSFLFFSIFALLFFSSLFFSFLFFSFLSFSFLFFIQVLIEDLSVPSSRSSMY